MFTGLDHNFNAHATRIPQHCPEMQVVRLPGMSYVDSGLSCDTFNIIHITDAAKLQFSDLQQTLDHFRRKEFAYCIWISQKQLTAKVQDLFQREQLNRQNTEPGMVLNLAEYQLHSNPLHDQIRLAETEEDVRQFADIIARNWSPPDEEVRTYYARTASYYLDPANEIYLALCYDQGTPAGVLEIFASDRETVGLYGLATLLSYRGRGIGKALMTYGLTVAKAKGYRRAILQASEDGIGIYKDLGFRDVSVYYEYA